MAYDKQSGPTTKKIINIVDEFESSEKSDFIEDLMNIMSEDQRKIVLSSFENSSPLPNNLLNHNNK